MADRLSDRGGADWHLRGVLASQAAAGEPQLAIGRRDPGVASPVPAHLLPGLEARGRAPVAGALDALVERVRPELIHLHNLTNPEALEWGAARGALLTLQDHRSFCPARGKWTADGRVCRDRLERDTCAGCFGDPAYFDEVLALTQERLAAVRRLRVVVLSQYMRDELLAVGLPAERVHVVPPFVHQLPLPGGPQRTPAILVAGRLVQAKGVLEAVEVWRRSGLPLPLRVAGAGPLRPELERAGAECLGWLARPSLAQAYRDAAALLLTPRWQEPFGIVGLEALSLGTPVVAWDAGGIREWHPRGERLAAWGDVDALAGELREAVASRAAPLRGFEAATQHRRLLAVYRRHRAEG